MQNESSILSVICLDLKICGHRQQIISEASFWYTHSFGADKFIPRLQSCTETVNGSAASVILEIKLVPQSEHHIYKWQNP